MHLLLCPLNSSLAASWQHLTKQNVAGFFLTYYEHVCVLNDLYLNLFLPFGAFLICPPSSLLVFFLITPFFGTDTSSFLTFGLWTYL